MSWGANTAPSEPTTTERLEEIRKLLPKLKTERLERVRDTKPNEWTSGRFVDEKGCRCLVGHLENWKVGKNKTVRNQEPLNDEAPRALLMLHFDALASKLGGPAKAALEIRKLVLPELERRQKKAA